MANLCFSEVTSRGRARDMLCRRNTDDGARLYIVQNSRTGADHAPLPNFDAGTHEHIGGDPSAGFYDNWRNDHGHSRIPVIMTR